MSTLARQLVKSLRQGTWDEKLYHRTPLDLRMRRNPLAQEHGLFNLACEVTRGARRYQRDRARRDYELRWARGYLAESVAMRTGEYPFGSHREADRLQAAE